MLPELLERYRLAMDRSAAHPILLIGLMTLDFLAIHPVADGNGRSARLLTTQSLLAHGYQVPRYVSVEGRILETKDAYYDALYVSQRRWHEGAHDVWPWLGYLVGVLSNAYDALELRVSVAQGSGVGKMQRVRQHVLQHAARRFRIADVRNALPGVSDVTLRLVLRQLRDEGLIEVDPHDSTGPTAAWLRIGAGHANRS